MTLTLAADAGGGTSAWQQALLALVAFVVVSFFSVRILRNVGATARRNRAMRLAKAQEATSEAQAAIEATREHFEAQLRLAATEADRIIEQERERARRVGEQFAQDARDGLDAIRAESNAQVLGIRDAAVAGVRDEAAGIAAELARSVTGADADEADTRKAVDRYVTERERDRT